MELEFSDILRQYPGEALGRIRTRPLPALRAAFGFDFVVGFAVDIKGLLGV